MFFHGLLMAIPTILVEVEDVFVWEDPLYYCKPYISGYGHGLIIPKNPSLNTPLNTMGTLF